MTLTEAQRRTLSEYAEWRDLQLMLNNFECYLRFTRLEDLNFGGMMETVELLATRRAAFLARWEAAQGLTREGTHADVDRAGAGAATDGGLSHGESDDSPVWSEGEGQSISEC